MGVCIPAQVLHWVSTHRLYSVCAPLPLEPQQDGRCPHVSWAMSWALVLGMWRMLALMLPHFYQYKCTAILCSLCMVLSSMGS